MKKAGLLLLILILSSCSDMFYYPQKEQLYDPESFGLQPEFVKFPSENGKIITGWLFPSKNGAPKGTIIQFHGNAENMTSHFLSLAWITEAGYQLFVFDYQGYGQSEGDASMENANRDSIAAYNYMLKHPSTHDIPLILYGQSIGGITLLKALEDFPARSRIACVVIESSFLSYQSIAREKLSESWLTWILQPLTYILISDKYAATDSVTPISPIPLLIIHGTEDHVVPFHFGKEIYSLAKEPKEFWKVQNGRHLDAMMRHDKRYRKKLVEYLSHL